MCRILAVQTLARCIVPVVCLTLAGCASFPLTQRQECHNAGFGRGKPGHDDCMARVKAEPNSAAQQADRNMAAIGTAFLGAVAASQASPSSPLPAGPHGAAPLVSQFITGAQRTCQYRNPTQIVTVAIASSTSCPATYAYCIGAICLPAGAVMQGMGVLVQIEAASEFG